MQPELLQKQKNQIVENFDFDTQQDLQKAQQLENQEQYMEANKIYQKIKASLEQRDAITYINSKISQNLQILRTNLKEKIKNGKKNKKQTENLQIIVLGKDIEIKKKQQQDGTFSYNYTNENNIEVTYSTKQIIEFTKKITQQQKDSQNTIKQINIPRISQDEIYQETVLSYLIEQQSVSKNNTAINNNKDDEKTEELEGDEQAILLNIQQTNEQQQQNWQIKNENEIFLYIKDEHIIINHLIAQCGQGIVYQCLNQHDNKLLVFKKMNKKNEYNLEKEIYHKLKQVEGKLKEYVFLDFFQYDDDFNLLIMSKAECNLLDYMKLRYKDFIEKRQESQMKDSDQKFHLSKEEFVSLLLFQVQAMELFEKENIYLQDNKPENILVQKQLVQADFVLELKYSDFGSIYNKNQIVNDQNCYPTAASPFYFDQNLYEEKNYQEYTEKEIIWNEIYTIARSLQKSLFPCNSSKDHPDSIIARENMKLFIEELNQQYDNEIGNIFLKMVDSEYKNRFTSFQDLQKTILQYMNNNKFKIQQQQWKDDNDQIREFNLKQIENFYNEYFEGILCSPNISIEKLFKINTFLQNEFLWEQSFLLLKKIEQKCINNLDKSSQGKFYNILGLTLQELGKLDKSLIYYHKSLHIYQNIYGKKHLECAQPLSDLSDIYYQLDQLKESEKMGMKALEIYDNNLEKNHIKSADTIQILGNVYTEQKKYKKALQQYQIALKIYEKDEGKISLQCTSCIENIGRVYLDQGDLKKAEENYLKSLEILTEFKGKDHLESENAMSNLGIVYSEQGRFLEAVTILQRNLEVLNLNYGSNSYKCSKTLGQLGEVYFNCGKIELGKQTLLKSLQINEKNLSKNTTESISDRICLGFIEEKLGNYLKSKQIFEETLKLLNDRENELNEKSDVEEEDGSDQDWADDSEEGDVSPIKEYDEDSDITSVLGWLNFKLRGNSDHVDEYIQQIKRALKVQEKEQNKINLAKSQSYLGKIYLEIGEYESSEKYLLKSLELRQNCYRKESHFSIGDNLRDLASLYELKGELDKALQYKNEYSQLNEQLEQLYSNL